MQQKTNQNSRAYRPAPQTTINKINEKDRWVSLTVTVRELWENNNPKIGQVGLIADDTGAIKFVSFAASNVQALEPGAQYVIQNCITDEYNGKFSVRLNRATKIAKLA